MCVSEFVCVSVLDVTLDDVCVCAAQASLNVVLGDACVSLMCIHVRIPEREVCRG